MQAGPFVWLSRCGLSPVRIAGCPREEGDEHLPVCMACGTWSGGNRLSCRPRQRTRTRAGGTKLAARAVTGVLFSMVCGSVVIAVGLGGLSSKRCVAKHIALSLEKGRQFDRRSTSAPFLVNELRHQNVPLINSERTDGHPHDGCRGFARGSKVALAACW